MSLKTIIQNSVQRSAQRQTPFNVIAPSDLLGYFDPEVLHSISEDL